MAAIWSPLPVLIGISEITRTGGSVFHSRFAAVSRLLSLLAASLPRPPACRAALHSAFVPLFPPVSLLLLLLSEVSSLHTRSLCFLFVPALVPVVGRYQFVEPYMLSILARLLVVCVGQPLVGPVVPVSSNVGLARRFLVF